MTAADHQRLARAVYDSALALNHAALEAARAGLVVDVTLLSGDALPAVPRVTARVLLPVPATAGGG